MYLYKFLESEYEQIKLNVNIQNLKNKTFFITGANGLIGSNIANYLYFLNNKYDLGIKLIMHSFSEAVSWLPREDNCEFISSDLTETVPDIRFDYLIHTATYGQPKKFVQNKLGTIKLNTETYISLLNLCKKNNAEVLYMSSSEVYGQVPENIHSVDENYFGNVGTLTDRAVYAEAKRIAETISNVYAQDGLYIRIIRLVIGYGPGVKLSDSRFMNEFIKRALFEKSLKMQDSGKAFRCFCFISDVVEMMLNILFSGKQLVYNVVGKDNKSIAEVAESIARIVQVPLEVPQDGNGIGGTPSQLILDGERYNREFGKNNYVSFEDGLAKTIEWMRLLGQEN